MRARTALALGAALVLGASLFGSPSLLPAGFALIVLPVAAALWVLLASAGTRIERELPRGSLIEDRDYELGLSVRTPLLPPPAAELTDPLIGEPLALSARHRRHAWTKVLRFPRRGRIELGAAELEIADPLGLIARTVRGAPGGEAIVLPRTEPISFSASGSGRSALGLGERGSGGAGPDSWNAEFEIDGLRPYRKGSPASRIHWPTVARTGELHELRITSGADAARLVILDPRHPSTSEALDAAVRATASICLELGSGPGCTLLVGGEPRPVEVEAGLRNFATAHRLLALVEPTSGPPATQRISRAGVVIWISADPTPVVEQALRRVAAGRRLLVRPTGPPTTASRTPALFRVSGCEARELGSRARRPRASAAA